MHTACPPATTGLRRRPSLRAASRPHPYSSARPLRKEPSIHEAPVAPTPKFRTRTNLSDCPPPNQYFAQAPSPFFVPSFPNNPMFFHKYRPNQDTTGAHSSQIPPPQQPRVVVSDPPSPPLRPFTPTRVAPPPFAQARSPPTLRPGTPAGARSMRTHAHSFAPYPSPAPSPQRAASPRPYTLGDRVAEAQRSVHLWQLAQETAAAAAAAGERDTLPATRWATLLEEKARADTACAGFVARAAALQRARVEREERARVEKLERERALREEMEANLRANLEEGRRQAAELAAEEAAREQELLAKRNAQAARRREARARLKLLEQTRRLAEEKEKEKLQSKESKVIPVIIPDRLARYERMWNALRPSVDANLGFTQMPWPTMKEPQTVAGLTQVAIEEFIHHPQRPGMEGKGMRSRIRDELIRWHPDKFTTRVLDKVIPRDRNAVLEGAGIVTGILTQLMTEA